MKKMFLMAFMLLIGMAAYSSPVVKATSIRMDENQFFVPSNYDSICTVLDNSIEVYIYKDMAIARAPRRQMLRFRAKIGNKWYNLPEREFNGLYRGKRLSRKYMKKIENFAE